MKSTIEAMKQARRALEFASAVGASWPERVASQYTPAIEDLDEAIAREEAQSIPENCGSGHCSCIKCFKEEAQSVEPVPETTFGNINGKRESLVRSLSLAGEAMSLGAYFRGLFADAADMLAADACSAARERHTRETLHKVLAGIEAQQVAVPNGLADATNALLHQIDIGDFVDSHGHSAKMLQPVHKLMTLLAAAPQPPQADARVPMTEGEVRSARLETEYDGTPAEPLIHRSTHARFAAFATAIEAHHGIKP